MSRPAEATRALTREGGQARRQGLGGNLGRPATGVGREYPEVFVRSGPLDEEMSEHSHRESGQRRGDRAEPDFAALVRQRNLLWHGLHFPSLAGGVKFWARGSDQHNFLIYINVLC